MPRHYFLFGLVCAWLAAGLAGAAELIERPEIKTEPVMRPIEPSLLPEAQFPAAAGLTLPVLPTDVALLPPEAAAETAPQAPETRPTFQTPAIPKQWRAQPGGMEPNFEQSLESIFDRRLRNGVSLPGTSIIVGHPLTERGVQAALRRKDLHSEAAPWRTEAQLQALKKAPRAQDEPYRFTVIGDAEPGRFALWRVLFNVPGVFARLLKDFGAPRGRLHRPARRHGQPRHR